MRKTTALLFTIAIAVIAAGCGQADFAKVTVESFRVEEGEAGGDYIVLSMQIENLTDANLYIESTSPTGEEGEKHLWFVVKGGDGEEYASTYYKDIESDIFPMSVSPRTTTTGEMAFDVPSGLESATLEVYQDETGEEGSKVILSQNLSP